MHIKIFFDSKIVYLCDALDEKLNKLLHQPSTVFIDELNTHTIKAMLKEIAEQDMNIGIFLHSNLSALKKDFFKKFEVMQAAGGAVLNTKNEILMIYRRGFWDLPKGKLDKGETLAECAVREVQEETGLKNVTINEFLHITYHTYFLGTHHILKESHWYKMKAKGSDHLIPQTEEDILEAKWISSNELEKYKKLSYPSIVEVLDELGIAKNV